MNRENDNNKVEIIGNIASGFTFSHQAFGEDFYNVEVDVQRLSDYVDKIPVMVSDRMIDVSQDYTGERVEISGEFRSYNLHDGERHPLILSVLAKELNFAETDDDECMTDRIFLDGYICKKPIFRKTPFGREITDVFLAINRAYGKSDYIPCICWGRNAHYVASLPVGTRLHAWGRIQSREYKKKMHDGECETRTAYEVSIGLMKVV